MSGKHARLSASAAHRWLRCAPSVNAGAGRNEPSIYAAEGTFAHEIGAACLMDPAKSPRDWLGLKRHIDGFDVECTPEMVESVQFYLDTISEMRRASDMFWVEMPLLDALQSVDPDLGGTADCVTYCPDTQQLVVIDFKYGSGKFVEADDNEQLKMYALGALLASKQRARTIAVVIIQPRFEGAKPVREWSFPAHEIMDFIADVKEAAARSRDPEAAFVAGDHCRFCPARRDCPELAKRQTALMANDFSEITTYDPQKLSEALAAIPLVKARIKAIEEFAYAEAVRGTFGAEHGWKLVDKRPIRQWVDEGRLVEWAKAHAVDPYDAPKVLSPAQLEKRLAETAARGKKKEAAAPIQKFIVAVSSGQTLVPVGDHRQEVKKISESDFAAVDGTAETQQQPPVVNLF